MVDGALYFVSVTVGSRLGAHHAVAFIERKKSVPDDLMICQIQDPMRTDKCLLNSRDVIHYAHLVTMPA